MTQMPVKRLVFSLGIPTTVSMLVTTLYNMVDTYFVAQIGTSATAATGVVFALMAIIQAFGFLLGHGAGSNISRHLGAQNISDARKFASTSFYLALICGLGIMLVGLLFRSSLMHLLGSTPTILPYACSYGTYILMAAPAMTAGCVLNNIIRYEGRAVYAMLGLVSGAVLNIVGDWLTMGVLHMGIEGAGISTAVSQYVSLGVLLIPFVRGKVQSRLSVKYITRQKKDVGNIIAVGMPSMVRQGLNSISTTVLNWEAALYGGDAAVAAMSIVMRICGFIFCVGLGIGQGFQPVSAYNYGARKYSRVREGFAFTIKFGITFLGLLSLAGFIWARPLVTMFRSDPQVVEIGTFALKMQAVALCILPLSVCGNMLFQSIGKSGPAIFLAGLRSGICFIPLVVVLPLFIGITGIQVAQPIADVLAAICTVPFLVKFFRDLPPDGGREDKKG